MNFLETSIVNQKYSINISKHAKKMELILTLKIDVFIRHSVTVIFIYFFILFVKMRTLSEEQKQKMQEGRKRAKEEGRAPDPRKVLRRQYVKEFGFKPTRAEFTKYIEEKDPTLIPQKRTLSEEQKKRMAFGRFYKTFTGESSKDIPTDKIDQITQAIKDLMSVREAETALVNAGNKSGVLDDIRKEEQVLVKRVRPRKILV